LVSMRLFNLQPNTLSERKGHVFIMARRKEHSYSEHLLAEKERIGKLSHIRELVFGAQDGLLVPLGVVSSVAGAFNNNHIVLVAGISEALAGAFSMATGAYLSSQAEQQVYNAEIAKERQSIQAYPSDEQKEMRVLFEREGMDTNDADTVANILWKHKNAFFTTMVLKELGIEPEPPGTPVGDALFVGLSYLAAAAVPLFPYFFLNGEVAILTSILVTLLALFCIGLLKARFALLPYLKSGLQVLLVGAGSGIGGYLLGNILPHVLGIK
jgi:VIT1/CCC1 family predicted Fe2+/Mn2+ transporter